MTSTFDRLLLWSPRVLGVLTAVFLGLFALDALERGKPLPGMLADFGMHLFPAFFVAVLVTLSFRWPLSGGIGFLFLAALYPMVMAQGRLDWILVISGPLAVVGALFVWTWIRGLRRAAGH